MAGEGLLELTGASIQAVGTAIAAAGEALVAGSSPILGEKLVVIGNGTEASGNALQAVALSAGRRSLAASGSWFQAAGNAANTVAGVFILNGDRENGLRLDILGDSVQAAGAAIEAAAVDPYSPLADIIAAGEYLVSFGAAIEAIGAYYLLKGKEEEGNSIQAFGSILQFSGASTISAALSKRYIINRNAPLQYPQRS
ncbi:DUF6944 family repetitive protein [Metabacillus sp. 84]|uniref:DUF6944 family repetitive protein n=1 Tax=Metabacillus sp. 84 TaxID=3404705 RepID=UPI003CFABFC2